MRQIATYWSIRTTFAYKDTDTGLARMRIERGPRDTAGTITVISGIVQNFSGPKRPRNRRIVLGDYRARLVNAFGHRSGAQTIRHDA
jgi:hypothetical protein